MLEIRAISGQYFPLSNFRSRLRNGHPEIDSLEREESIPFTGRDLRLGQSWIISSEREDGRGARDWS